MKSLITLFATIVVVLTASTHLSAQCALNANAYGGAFAPTTPTPEFLTNCGYAGDHQPLIDALAANTYDIEYVGGSGSTITVYTWAGVYVTHGNDNITFSPPSDGNYRISISTYSCGPEFTCRVGTITCTSCSTAPTATNDLCANRKTMQLGVNNCASSLKENATNTGTIQTLNANAPGCAQYNPNNGVVGEIWYSVTVPTSGKLSVETSDDGTTSVYNTGFSVYSGSCGSLVEIGCDANSSTGLYSFLTMSGLTPGSEIIIATWDYFNDDQGTFDICAWDPDPTPLPIELTSFVGHTEYDHNVLKWSTEAEVDFSHFIIERSVNSGTFQEIGQVFGEGSASQGRTYTFQDDQPRTKAFYRLRMVDTDGSQEISNLVVLERESDNGIHIYPNPASSTAKIQINITSPGQITYSISDISGRIIQTQAQDVSPGMNNIDLDLSQYSAGIYHVEVTDNMNQTHVQKLAIR